MNEYQIIFTVDNQFVFRTEWESNVDRVRQTLEHFNKLHTNHDNTKIIVYDRSLAMFDVTKDFI